MKELESEVMQSVSSTKQYYSKIAMKGTWNSKVSHVPFFTFMKGDKEVSLLIWEKH